MPRCRMMNQTEHINNKKLSNKFHSMEMYSSRKYSHVRPTVHHYACLSPLFIYLCLQSLFGTH